MQDIINFLVQNPEVIEKVQEGTVTLLGVTAEEVKGILEVFTGDGSLLKKVDYWK